MKTRDTCIGLESAEWVERGPFSTPSGRTASQRKGLRYEKSVYEDLVELYPDADIRHGQWIRFKDRRGTGHAQPDVVALFPDRIVLVEVKFTYRPPAKDKLRRVYWRLLRTLDHRPILCVQVCRGFGGNYDGSCVETTLSALSTLPFKDKDYVVVHHW